MSVGFGARERVHERALIEAMDEGQDAIARDLHDTLCQTLGGARLSAAAIRRRLASSGINIDSKGLEEAIGRSIYDLQAIMQSLQRVEIQPSALLESLEALVIGAKNGQFTKGSMRTVQDAFAASQVFRIVREVVSRAGRIGCGLAVSWSAEEESCVLRAVVDAPVFSSRAMQPCPSLATLQRRARAVSGELRMNDSGSSITLRLPSGSEAERTPL